MTNEEIEQRAYTVVELSRLAELLSLDEPLTEDRNAALGIVSEALRSAVSEAYEETAQIAAAFETSCDPSIIRALVARIREMKDTLNAG